MGLRLRKLKSAKNFKPKLKTPLVVIGGVPTLIIHLIYGLIPPTLLAAHTCLRGHSSARRASLLLTRFPDHQAVTAGNSQCFPYRFSALWCDSFRPISQQLPRSLPFCSSSFPLQSICKLTLVDETKWGRFYYLYPVIFFFLSMTYSLVYPAVINDDCHSSPQSPIDDRTLKCAVRRLLPWGRKFSSSPFIRNNHVSWTEKAFSFVPICSHVAADYQKEAHAIAHARASWRQVHVYVSCRVQSREPSGGSQSISLLRRSDKLLSIVIPLFLRHWHLLLLLHCTVALCNNRHTL